MRNPSLSVPLRERREFAKRRDLWIVRCGEHVVVYQGKPRPYFGYDRSSGEARSVWVGSEIQAHRVDGSKLAWLSRCCGDRRPRQLLIYRTSRGRFFMRPHEQRGMQVGPRYPAEAGWLPLQMCRDGFKRATGLKISSYEYIRVEVGSLA